MKNDRSLGDRLRIRETIERYFFGVDSKDREVLVSCFSSDAEAEDHCTTSEYKIVVGGERGSVRTDMKSCLLRSSIPRN